MSATAIGDNDVFEATMNAVIIYEEREVASKARALLKRASERADAATRWSVKPWRVDVLNWPALAPEALRDAAGAHLLVLAVGAKAELPPGLLKWLETWAACRQVPEAALALFDGGSGDTLSATATPALAEFAQRHGLSLVLGDVSAAKEESANLWKDLHERQVAVTPTMAHILEEAAPVSYQHWGINE